MQPVKLKIIGFTSDPSGKPRSIMGGGITFRAEIPPEKITFSKGIQWNNNSTANTSSVDVMQFQGYEQEQLSIDLILDSTGAFGDGVGNRSKGVLEQSDKLHEVVYEYHGPSHKPRYVVVNFGGKNWI